jgi:tRNA pseudouridine55 synthase
MLGLATAEALAADSQAALREKLLPPDVALTGFPPVSLDKAAGERFSGGQVVRVSGDSRKGLARVYESGERFLGVGELADNGELAPRRVFLTPTNNPVDI